MLRTALLAALLAATLQTPPAQDRPAPTGSDQDKLLLALRGQGVELDRAQGWCAIPAVVEVRDALLEYLLVGPAGRTHESLFLTEVAPSVLNTALILLGAEPGKNASWRPKEPAPSEAELRNGISPWVVELPQGFGLYVYIGWKLGGEVYFYRVEDLLRDLTKGRSMQRHRWVYLGSRMVSAGNKDKPDEQAFAADLYQDVINIAFFSESVTVLTAALPECVEQTIWLPNAWLLPERGEHVQIVFSRERLDSAPAELARLLPEVAAPRATAGEGR